MSEDVKLQIELLQSFSIGNLQSAIGNSQWSHFSPAWAFELIHFSFDLRLNLAVALQQEAHELVSFARNDVQVVVSELPHFSATLPRTSFHSPLSRFSFIEPSTG
jgi:hypothetical protein